MMILFFALRGNGVGTAQQSAAWSKERLVSGNRHHSGLLKLSNSSQLEVRKGYVNGKERHHSALLHGVGTVQQFTARIKEGLHKWEGETSQQSSARCKNCPTVAAWSKESLQGKHHSALLHTNV